MQERHSTFSPCSSTCQIFVDALTGLPSAPKSCRIVCGELTASSEPACRFSYTAARPPWMRWSATEEDETAAAPRATALTRKRRKTLFMVSSTLLNQYLVPPPETG